MSNNKSLCCFDCRAYDQLYCLLGWREDGVGFVCRVTHEEDWCEVALQLF